jgi:hypothetical protein
MCPALPLEPLGRKLCSALIYVSALLVPELHCRIFLQVGRGRGRGACSVGVAHRLRLGRKAAKSEKAPEWRTDAWRNDEQLISRRVLISHLITILFIRALPLGCLPPPLPPSCVVDLFAPRSTTVNCSEPPP